MGSDTLSYKKNIALIVFGVTSLAELYQTDHYSVHLTWSQLVIIWWSKNKKKLSFLPPHNIMSRIFSSSIKPDVGPSIETNYFLHGRGLYDFMKSFAPVVLF